MDMMEVLINYIKHHAKSFTCIISFHLHNPSAYYYSQEEVRSHTTSKQMTKPGFKPQLY